MVLGREAILGCFSPFIQGSIWLKEKEGKEEEKKRKNKRSSRNPGLEYLFLYGSLVWDSCLEILV